MNDVQFVTLYSMMQTIIQGNPSADGEDIMAMFRQIHEECESRADDIERDAVRTVAKQMIDMSDTPDMYIMKAGLSGMMENLFKKNS